MDDFPALVDLFKPIFHTLMLIWKNSRYYNNAARFVTLVQQMCNDLIMQVRSGRGPGGGECRCLCVLEAALVHFSDWHGTRQEGPLQLQSADPAA